MQPTPLPTLGQEGVEHRLAESSQTATIGETSTLVRVTWKHQCGGREYDGPLVVAATVVAAVI
jgi:hypothetical protein